MDMNRWVVLIAMILLRNVCIAQSLSNELLRYKLEYRANAFKGIIGVAVAHLEKGDTLTIKGYERFPMQSVYKFPLAMAVLNRVDNKKLSLNTKVHVTKSELHTNTWSPFAKKYPNGNVDVTVDELLMYTVSKSDNNTCDILFKLMGGINNVHNYFKKLGYTNMKLGATEKQMYDNHPLADSNWCYPAEMNRLLVNFYKGKHLSKTSRAYLLGLMTDTENSPKRLKGLLPEATEVAHKTGTGDHVVNDAGIITLPDGTHLAVTLMVNKAEPEYEETELLMAQLTQSIYNAYASTMQLDSVQYVLDSAYKAAPFFANILVSDKGKPVFERSYGMADAVKEKPLAPSNSFQVASISKQFTAYGMMLLQSQGKLNYEDKVQKYLSDFPYPEITIKQLLQHTSGLPDFWEGIRPKMDTTKSFGNKEVLAYLIKHKPALQFTPGTRFEYCDIGYDFLANIIEQVSGMGYDVFLKKNIFEPLQMNDTYAYLVTDIERIQNPNLAIGHVYTNGKFEYAHTQPKNRFVFYLGDFYGDGSVVTTTHDLAKWDKALSDCTLLPCDSQQAAFVPAVLSDDTTSFDAGWAYGFGWFTYDGPQGKMVYHTGFHPGNVHAIYRLVDRERTLIFLSNSETPAIRNLRRRVLKLVQR